MIWKCRASQVGHLMTPPKDAGDKAAGNLSQKAKTFLDEEAIRIYYGGRENPLRTEPLRKGEECEEQAITMLMERLGEWTEKNSERYEDDFFTGEPDVISNGVVYDTKVPFDIWSFHKAEPPVLKTGKKTLYYWQLQAYMELTGLDKACLVYCLVDTPDAMLDDKLHRLKYQFEDGDGHPEYELYEKQLIAAHKYGDIPEEKRVKMYNVERSEEDLVAMKEKVEKARDYLTDWKL